MEISPIKIFYMVSISLIFGVCVGVLNDADRIVRMLLGQVYEKRRFEFLHNISLPISKRKIDPPRQSHAVRTALNFIVFLQDVFLFAVSAVGVAFLNYYFNNGRARIFTPLAVITGFLFYYFTVGNLVLYFSDIIVTLIRLVFLTFFEILYYPVMRFANFFVLFAKNLYKNLDKTIAKKQKKVYNSTKGKNVMYNADFGFVDIAKERTRRT